MARPRSSSPSTPETTGTSRRLPRIIAAVLLIVLAVAALAVSALSMFNWSAQRSYDSASARLRGNVAAARSGSRPTSDIQASQRRVDADLADLSSSSAVQVRPISDAVRTASTTSRRLDRILDLMAKGKSWSQAAKEASSSLKDSRPAGSAAAKKKSSGSKSSGTTANKARSDEQAEKEQEEQKKKLDRLVSRTQSSTDSTTKPW